MYDEKGRRQGCLHNLHDTDKDYLNLGQDLIVDLLLIGHMMVRLLFAEGEAVYLRDRTAMAMVWHGLE